jgi:hypothetical protein
MWKLGSVEVFRYQMFVTLGGCVVLRCFFTLFRHFRKALTLCGTCDGCFFSCQFCRVFLMGGAE